MTTYLAFLRGINVGGNALIKMPELKDALAASGLEDVRTYIQSGNVIFRSQSADKSGLAEQIVAAIQTAFGLDVSVAVFSDDEWHHIIAAAPAWWGRDPEWKHNLLMLVHPYEHEDAMAAIGELKPDIEAAEPGEGVVYQSMSRKMFGRTTTGKLASNPIYKHITVRNFNTANKLLALLP